MVMEGVELNNNELRNTSCNLDGDPKIGWLCNKNGLLLKTYAWIVKNPIGNILLIHGFETHTRANFMRKKLKMPNNNKSLVVGDNNYYIYKDSWIEKFNQNGYSIYGVDLQGHGGSQSLGKLRGTFNCFDDLVDDVIQYMNQIYDETSSDNQKNDGSHNIPTTKKKRLPMYIIGYSMGANIALRILQLLKKEKEDRIQAKNSNKYKKSKTMLCSSNDINEIGNGMYDMNNSNDYDFDNSCGSGNHKGRYDYLDKLNIKGCVSISGMMRIKSILDSENKSFWQYFLPIFIFMSYVMPHIEISSESHYKKLGCFGNIYKHYILPNINGSKFKWRSECVKATIKLDRDVNYMPKDIPLLFVHSKDDGMCSYVGMILFYNKLNVNDKELYTVNGMNHSTTKRPGNEDILKKIIDWICNLRKNGEDEI
ncbi:lysophospholipase, putative [Plasmodium chabaudi adami]|uniref:Lysophospholipase, putative n=1 Tax=Plasmodium chabaudi adami TaxID=5826 RepID=A0A1D3L9J3_PLACE|nr:lysophospholipase, putative [Plasmodium chabaudi adami]